MGMCGLARGFASHPVTNLELDLRSTRVIHSISIIRLRGHSPAASPQDSLRPSCRAHDHAANRETRSRRKVPPGLRLTTATGSLQPRWPLPSSLSALDRDI
jgi:hypothetical protein